MYVAVVRRFQRAGVYLRDLSSLSTDLCGRYAWVAVCSAAETERIVAALGAARR
jgi:hypothetical protein